MNKSSILTTIILLLSVIGYSQTKGKNVMLVLGSAIPETLSSRVNFASKFYKAQKIDKIIVSGGCGAHASSICEASAMKNQLIEKGIPGNIIYKEENSKTTVQNYIFSRVLKDENGKQIIEKNDSLFVVSDHWHAIAVAARFNKYDEVHAKFVIEGDLVPKPNDLLDYGGIFNNVLDNKVFVMKGVWPTPNAVFTDNGVTRFVFSDRVYAINNGNFDKPTISDTLAFKAIYPILLGETSAMSKDEKENRILVFNSLGFQIIKLPKNISSVVKLNQLITGLPNEVTSIDASFIKDNDLYLFSGNEVIIAGRAGSKFKVSKVQKITDWVGNWPYAWGTGDLAAADYDVASKTILLYKNREVLKISENNNSASTPKRLDLKWQDIDNQLEKK